MSSEPEATVLAFQNAVHGIAAQTVLPYHYGTHLEGPGGAGPFTGFMISNDFGQSWSGGRNDATDPLFPTATPFLSGQRAQRSRVHLPAPSRQLRSNSTGLRRAPVALEQAADSLRALHLADSATSSSFRV